MTRPYPITAFAFLLILLFAACDREDLQSVEQTADEAVSGIGTELKEERIDQVLNNFDGLDGVSAELQENGSVTLIGTVASEDLKARAEEIVRDIKGVADVQNVITISSGLGDDLPGFDSAAGDTL